MTFSFRASDSTPGSIVAASLLMIFRYHSRLSSLLGSWNFCCNLPRVGFNSGQHRRGASMDHLSATWQVVLEAGALNDKLVPVDVMLFCDSHIRVTELSGIWIISTRSLAAIVAQVLRRSCHHRNSRLIFFLTLSHSWCKTGLENYSFKLTA